MEPIKVLNAGFASLVDVMGTDLSTVNAARVSVGKQSGYAQRCNECGTEFGPDSFCVQADRDCPCGGAGWTKVLPSGDQKLITYLAEHGHVSPFRHAAATIHFKMPIMCARQVAKHQVGCTISEISGRYVEFNSEDYYMPELLRSNPEQLKQGSSLEPVYHQTAAMEIYKQANRFAIKQYQELLRLGVCKEQARGVLPLGLYTEFYMTGTLAAWAHFLNLRLDGHAQWETRQYAKAAETLLLPLFPHSLRALVNPEVLSQQEA